LFSLDEGNIYLPFPMYPNDLDGLLDKEYTIHKGDDIENIKGIVALMGRREKYE